MLNAALAEPTARTAPTRQASCLSRVRVLAVLTSTADTEAERAVADRLASHQPAFWSLATYSDHRGIILRDFCNDIGPCAALEALKDRETPYGFTVADLDRLLPLNESAVRQLRMAFSNLGIYRDAADLMERTDAAETLPIKTEAMGKLAALYRGQAA